MFLEVAGSLRCSWETRGPCISAPFPHRDGGAHRLCLPPPLATKTEGHHSHCFWARFSPSNPPAIYLAAPDAGEAFQPVMATDEAPTCAVCLEPTSASTLAVMPCCDREGATVAFCLRCIELVCQHGPGNVGRCPKCRAYVKISADGSAVEAAERFATCAMCRQDRQIVDGGVCDACVLGVRHRLRYECQRCGGAQMVGWREGRESAVWFLILASSRVGRRDVRLAVVSTRARVNE